MAFTVVQAKGAATATDASPTVTLDAAPTQGNLLVAWICCGNTQAAISLAGWTGGTLQSTGSGGTQRAGRMFYKVAGAGESATITGSLTSTSWVIQVVELSAPAATPLLTGNSGITFTSTSTLTPTSGKEAMVVFGMMTRSTAGTWSGESITGTGTGVANLTEQLDTAASVNAGSCLVTANISPTSGGTYTGNGTPSAGSVGVNAIMIFEAAAAQDTPELYGRPFGSHGQAQMHQLLSF